MRRQSNLLNRRIKLARFPTLKTVEDFDFAFNPAVKKKDVLSSVFSRRIFIFLRGWSFICLLSFRRHNNVIA
jgi:DNA replication protein DnaC